MFRVLIVFHILFTFSMCLKENPWHFNGIFRGKNYLMQPGVPKILEEGGQLAFEHCQKQFKWERWNCPRNAFTRWNTVAEQLPTREVAYVDAIISAGIMYAVIRNCSNDTVCRTKQTYKESDLVWAIGFEENTAIGESFSKRYLDSVVTSQDVQGLINLHNIAVGRAILRKTMIRKCQCHGVSGTCAMKTCWNKMPPFNIVADVLFNRYTNAVRMDYEIIGNSASLFDTFQKFSEVKNEQLIYMVESPNYCISNSSTEWSGTRGRTCSRNHGEDVSISEKRSCRELCKKCGYQVRRKKMVVKKQCNCKFSWCCEVKCDVCSEVIKEHYCH